MYCSDKKLTIDSFPYVSSVPVPTCVLGPCRPDHSKYFPAGDGGDLAPNITYLGRKGLYTGSSGLTVAYLSGLDGAARGGDDTHFSADDMDALRLPITANAKFAGVDVLLSTVWPYGVEKYATAVVSGLEGFIVWKENLTFRKNANINVQKI